MQINLSKEELELVYQGLIVTANQTKDPINAEELTTLSQKIYKLYETND